MKKEQGLKALQKIHKNKPWWILPKKEKGEEEEETGEEHRKLTTCFNHPYADWGRLSLSASGLKGTPEEWA